MGKSLLSGIVVSLFCWTCFGGMNGMSAMAMGIDSNSTTIQCADSACGVSNTVAPMTAGCATQCLTKATEGAPSVISLEGAATALVVNEVSRNEWPSAYSAEKTQRKFVPHHQRMFVVQRE